jgi:hypothetical protein
LESGLEVAEVVLVELVDRTHGAGEEASPERAGGDEADAQLTDGGQDLAFGSRDQTEYDFERLEVKGPTGSTPSAVGRIRGCRCRRPT